MMKLSILLFSGSALAFNPTPSLVQATKRRCVFYNIELHISRLHISHGSHSSLSAKQDFLEASPYHDQTNVPVNTYKNKVIALRVATEWQLSAIGN